MHRTPTVQVGIRTIPVRQVLDSLTQCGDPPGSGRTSDIRKPREHDQDSPPLRQQGKHRLAAHARPHDPADYERPELDGSCPKTADVALARTAPWTTGLTTWPESAAAASGGRHIRGRPAQAAPDWEAGRSGHTAPRRRRNGLAIRPDPQPTPATSRSRPPKPPTRRSTPRSAIGSSTRAPSPRSSATRSHVMVWTCWPRTRTSTSTVIRPDIVKMIPNEMIQDILDYHSGVTDAAETATRVGARRLALTQHGSAAHTGPVSGVDRSRCRPPRR